MGKAIGNGKFGEKRVSMAGLMKCAMAFAAFLLFAPALPAQAQDGNTELRVKKLESEMRAVQRKVFPGGSDRFFEPEIQPEQRAAPPLGTSADGAVSDLLTRVDALEAQLAGLTAQTEQNNYKLGQMETRLAALEASAKAAADALPPASDGETGFPVGEQSNGQGGGTLAKAAKPVAAAAPPADRVAEVKAIVKPDTGNAGEDNYTYGYRLWEAKFYPEAQQQLKKTVETYPADSRNSFARNLLGRAYLDGGKLNLAAETFLKNYQEKPTGARAPDSLYYLGMTMMQLKQKVKACAAFDELRDAYGDAASGRLAGELATGRKTAGCK